LRQALGGRGRKCCTDARGETSLEEMSEALHIGIIQKLNEFENKLRETRLDDKLTYIRMNLSALQSEEQAFIEDMQPEIDYLDSATTSFKELILALSDAVVSLKSAEER
jgi:hypothetical protein